jgi:hypothetical protein
MEKNNMTAIEWLAQELPKIDMRMLGTYLTLIEHAKQMEKDQMEDCWIAAHQAGRFEGKGIAEEDWQTFFNYYNETYGKE